MSIIDPLDQIRIRKIMDISKGSSEIIIGVIDGPVDFDHSALKGSKIKTIKDSQLMACKNANHIACIHATFIAGILCAARGSSAPSICPDCQIVLRPIFSQSSIDDGIPTSSPDELSKAIIETVDAGARIINLSVGLSSSSLIKYNDLAEAYNYASKKGTVVVAAAGNQGIVGNVSIIDHPWVIPVAACDDQGSPVNTSNFGRSIANRGFLAPGVNVESILSCGGVIKLSGTSVATPFVTGAIALLWSIFPQAKASELIHSIKSAPIRTIIPPLLDVEQAFIKLKNMFG